MSSPPFCSTILPNCVGDDVFVGLGDGVFPGFFQLLQLRFVAADGLVALGDVGGVGNLDLCQSWLFGGVIRGADLVGALEGHVLEHVREAGLAHRVLHGTGIDQGEEGEDRSLRALADDDGQAVGQLS